MIIKVDMMGFMMNEKLDIKDIVNKGRRYAKRSAIATARKRGEMTLNTYKAIEMDFPKIKDYAG